MVGFKADLGRCFSETVLKTSFVCFLENGIDTKPNILKKKYVAGMAVARDLLGKSNNVISVIGDGAMTAGQAYEAMNNAGFLDSNLIVVLNDNKQVSLPTATLDGPATPVGALSSALAKIQASPKFRKLREAAKVRICTKMKKKKNKEK